MHPKNYFVFYGLLSGMCRRLVPLNSGIIPLHLNDFSKKRRTQNAFRRYFGYIGFILREQRTNREVDQADDSHRSSTGTYELRL